MNHKTLISTLCTGIFLLGSGVAMAHPAPGQVDRYLDHRGDRIEHRLDRKGDRINHRLDRRARVAEAHGHDRLARCLDRRGDRIDHRLDRAGHRIDRHLDRAGDRYYRRHR
jgi:hypothetical protein